MTRLRDRAETMATTAAAMKKIADAADPLYKTLDDGQKRRLARPDPYGGPVRPGGWRHHGFQRGMDRDDGGGTAATTGIVTTGTADRAGPGDRAARTALAPTAPDRSLRKSRWIPAAFCLSVQPNAPGKFAPALLDIGKSLC